MTNKHSNCETYEPLISAMIDGELAADERNELNSHLQNCVICKQRLTGFEQVDIALDTLSRDFTDATSPDPATLNSIAMARYAMRPRKIVPRNTNKLLIWRLIPFAAAATLLICLGIAAWPNPQPANAGLISPNQIVEPMKKLHLLNLQKQRDQDLMLRTLGMDLRSMKLEINMLDPGSTERVSLAAQIDAMIAKVNLFEANNYQISE